MNELDHFRKMFQHHWDGPMWHGANLQETLKDISWEKAFEKPAGFSHNIYELVIHMCCWRMFVLEYLNGNNTYSVALNSETDWITQYEVTETNWETALRQLGHLQLQLAGALEIFQTDRLEEVVAGKKFKWYIMLHGLLHHDIYHTAQINMLKRATTQPD